MALRYITEAELVNEIPETLQGSLTDDTPNSETKVSAIIVQQGESAEETVESYLGMVYVIPLIATDGTVPNSLKKAIFVLTKYYLYMRRDQVDAQMQAQYDTVLRWLKDIGSGRAGLNLLRSDGSVQSQGGSQIDVSAQTDSQFSNFV